MFNRPIVFIVGAGASREYDFPLGSDLKASVASKIRFRFEHGYRLSSGDDELLSQIRRHTDDAERQNVYTRSANVLADAMEMFISVDEALHYVSETPEAVEIGKIAIIGEIVAAGGDCDAVADRSSAAFIGWLSPAGIASLS